MSYLTAKGSVAPGFEAVRSEFERNLNERGDIGASFAVYHKGKKIIDLWGGHKDSARKKQWEEDTVSTIFSSTKGISALVLAHAHSQGFFEWDSTVAEYWPEFAQNGKQDITVRQLFAHQAGLCAVEGKVTLDMISDLDLMADLLAKQKPEWVTGTHQGYHAVCLGWYQNELLRRVDPKHRSIGQYLREEFSTPLGIDVHIGVDSSFPTDRIASMKQKLPMVISGFLDFKDRHLIPWRLLPQLANPNSISSRAFRNMPIKLFPHMNRTAKCRSVEIPSANGIANARGAAKLYSVLACEDGEYSLSKKTMADLASPTVQPTKNHIDKVMKVVTGFSLGFTKSNPERFEYASNTKAFGAPGAGGSFCFADPDEKLSMAYVMNSMGVYILDDPRERALRKATYKALNQLGLSATA